MSVSWPLAAHNSLKIRNLIINFKLFLNNRRIALNSDSLSRMKEANEEGFFLFSLRNLIDFLVKFLLIGNTQK